MNPTHDRSNPTPRSGRRHDIDALRVIATLALIVFHTARAFDTEPWHVKNDQLTLGMDILVTFMSVWHMPLFFTLAGMSAYFSLRKRHVGDYVNERVTRLLIPFSFGILLIIPPQVYVERINSAMMWRQSPIDFSGSYLEFFPQFFRGIYPEGNFSWHHLWFIAYLFLFSILLLPIFRFLLINHPADHDTWIHRVETFLSKGHRILYLALPIALIETSLSGLFPGPQNFVNDLTNVLRSMTLMVYGFSIAKNPALREAVRRNMLSALLVAGITTIIISIVLLQDGWPVPYSGLYFVLFPVWSVCRWAWIVGLLSIGDRYLATKNNWIGRLSEISFPFYILHQTVIVVIAHFVLPWKSGVIVKFTTIAAASLVITWLISIAVTWSPMTRFMFGIKRSHKSSTSRVASQSHAS